jgi:hypothetical protein
MVSDHHYHDARAADHAGRGKIIAIGVGCCLVFWGMIGLWAMGFI